MSHEHEQVLASVFRLAEGHFGVPAAEIQEVVQPGTVTPVHHAPECVAGIRNLRGHIVTVVDMRLKLGLGPARLGPESRILIVNSGDELVGLLVEAVEDTVFLDPESMSVAPPHVHGIEGNALRGVYQCRDWLLAMLDHNLVLKQEDAAQAGTPKVGQP